MPDLEAISRLETAIWPDVLGGNPKAIDTAIKILEYKAEALGLKPPPPDALCAHTRRRHEGEPIGVHCQLAHGHPGCHRYPKETHPSLPHDCPACNCANAD
jgi:hypothetical protein